MGSGPFPAGNQKAIFDLLPAGDQRFWQAMIAEDDLAAVIRTHTFVESALEELIRRHLVKSTDEIKKFFEHVGFTNQLALAHALDELEDWMLPALRQLQRMRNDFAHSFT